MTGTGTRIDLPRDDSIRIGQPDVARGAAIHRLVSACEPLDLNSCYAYLLLCEHFAATCVLAACAERVVGYISAYKPPRQQDTIFVWQVAVDTGMRGRGLASSMLKELLAREEVRACRYLETTVSPSNLASRRLFHGLARALNVPARETVLFAEEDFGAEHHESEVLIRIGPFPGTQ